MSTNVYIDEDQYFVTYEGQVSPCMYCGQPNHKQLDCSLRQEDYSQPPMANGNKQDRKQAVSPANNVGETQVSDSTRVATKNDLTRVVT